MIENEQEEGKRMSKKTEEGKSRRTVEEEKEKSQKE